MNTETPTPNKPPKLILAIIISILFHLGLGLPAWYFSDTEQASSLGTNQVILLQTSQQKPTPSQHKINQTSQEYALGQTTKQPETKSSTEGIKQKKNQANKQSSQYQQAKQKQVTSNQGSQADQSGKSLSPAQSYNIVLQQHLLNNMQNAPYFGKAKLDLKIMSSGMAIEIKVNVIDGPKAYGEWLKRIVYAANPFPKTPKGLSRNGFYNTSLKLQHAADE